ncbi:uncharacterized protein LOC126895026 [Daktulosphaira vitifoliae]|uniref:uncharacterized protein LOC126895026 n=1 Tax=Daktulosphaira vitifoliae TaxID=58002 RepID=UPI0021AAA0E0|nr:uncharacterized protein LOC126895026 [Daktulosphaira vitifoliae]
MSFYLSFEILLCFMNIITIPTFSVEPTSLNEENTVVGVQQIIRYISSVQLLDKKQLIVNSRYLNVQFYYNPIDEEWKREKCIRLGFTFNEHKEFNYNEVLSDNFNLYKVLSDLICGDEKFSIKLQKKICLSIKSNDHIKQLFLVEESFDDYLKDFIKFIDPVLPYNEDGAEECPICFTESDIPVVLNSCRHSFCYHCIENLLLKDTNICPLCRADFSFYLDKDEGNVISACGYMDLLAAAHYLDVCIFVHYSLNVWLYFDKDYTLDMKEKKCIYLYVYNNTYGIITSPEMLFYLP